MKYPVLNLKTIVRIIGFVFLSILGLNQSYAYEFTEGNLVYSVEDGVYGLTVVRHKDGTSATGALIIPSELYHEGNLFTVTRIGERAFFDSPGLTSLVIPNTVTYIGRESFTACSGITGNLVIPNLVTYIGRGAFWGCTGFSGGALTIPSSVTLIEENAFTDCGFTIINFNASNCTVNYGYPHLSYREESPFSGNPAKVNIGASVSVIPNNFLRSCNGITEGITIPNSVTSIGEYAFKECFNLTRITIPNSVTSIGAHAFEYCSYLTGISIPNSVTSVGANAFAYCSGLSCSLSLPSSLTSIGESAFCGCSGLIGGLSIPNSVTSIGERAFEGCSGFSGGITIPNSLTSIESRVFRDCIGLTGNLTIPISVTSIGDEAFRNCSNLTGILTIPNSVTSVGVGAFLGCNGFSTVNLPSSLNSIGYAAFNTGPALESIVIAGGNSVFDSRENCNAIIETATNKLVCGCVNTVIPESIISIGNAAFNNCGITAITIPNSVVEIGSNAFYSCPYLVSVIIGSSVATIRNYAFANCPNLATVFMLSTTPPTIGANTIFYNVDHFVIYVPYESLEAYLSNDYNLSTYYQYNIRCMTQKEIMGYGTGNDKWVFISSPIAVGTAPSEVENLMASTATEYDLYRFNQSAAMEWENYKAHTSGFVLENGKGYLYANKNDVTLTFSGVYSTDSSKEVSLEYDGSARLAGYNLVGNPFAEEAIINRNYYKMNDEGTGIVAEEVSSLEPIPPFTGVIVQATGENQSVTFTKVSHQAKSSGNGHLSISLSQANSRGQTMLDNAIVSFNKSSQLGKYYFGEQSANIYIPQNQEEYAIVSTDKQSEMPLNIVVRENDEYTLTINPVGLGMSYLHLLDNLTGADIDLLASPSYTFSAKNDDYASRFKLVFSAQSGNTEDYGDFAYISNGNIIINGEGTVLMSDVNGRIIISKEGVHSISTAKMSSGTYILSLIDGESVRNQKIIIK